MSVNQQYYSKLSLLKEYEWLKEYEKDREVYDSNNNCIVKGNSTMAVLEKDNPNDKIYKAYLVIEVNSRITPYQRLLETYPITFIGPSKNGIETKMDKIYFNNNKYYVGFVDVTDFVKKEGYGEYYCCNIPYPYYYDGFDAYGSWKLIVIEENEENPIRNLSLKIGSRYLDGKGKSATINMLNNGITTPKAIRVTGQILMSISGGDPRTTQYNSLVYSNDGTVGNEKEVTYGSSTIRTTKNPFTWLVSKNLKPITNATKYGKDLYLKDGFLSESPIYGYTKIAGTDLEIFEIDGTLNKHNIRFTNNVDNMYFKISNVENCKLMVSTMGVSIDVEYPKYEMNLTNDGKDENIVIKGSSKNVYETVENVGLYQTEVVVEVDKDIDIEDVNAIFIASNGERTEYNLSENPELISINSETNEVTIKWGVGEDKLTLKDDNIEFIINGKIKNSKTLYINSAYTSGYLYLRESKLNNYIDKISVAKSEIEYKKNIEVQSLWEDNENEANKRPSSVILQIFDGERLIIEAEVNEEDEWKHTFTNLLKYREDGSEINYTVNEKSFATDKFYTKEIVGNIITNRFIVPEDKIKIIGIKSFNDNNNEANKRPESIMLQVKSNDTVVAEQIVNEANNWRYEFELSKYDRLGNEIEYTIDEKDTGNKFYIKEKVEKISDTETIVTNKYEVPDERISVEVTKIWEDNNNEANKRPSSVILQIFDGERLITEAEVTEESEWKHTFTNLLKYREDGSEIEYTVNEKSFVTDKFYTKEIVGNTITNRFTVPEDKIKIVGIKSFNDNNNEADKRPESITLQVKANDTVVAEQNVNEANNWRYEFELSKYDRLGNEIEYTIDEKDTGSKFYTKEKVEKKDNEITVTNKFEVPNEKINLEVMKTWDDNGNVAGKRPNSITLQVKTGGVVVAEQVVSSANGWKHTFELAKYNETGDEIEYTVDEKELDEESSKFYIKEIVGNVITNKFVVLEDRINIVGTKVWNDNGNAGGKRDKSVILQLKVGENIISEAQVDENDNWSYEFEVSKYDELGNEIEYYIDERYSGNKFYKKVLTDKNTVTNEFVVPEEKILVKAVKKWEDNNNEYGKRPGSVVLQVYNKDKLVVEEKVSADNNWSYEVKLPKYDEYGDEIEYRVNEKGTSKYYEKVIEGNVVINKCVYEPVVDTNDINVLSYIVIFFVSIVGIIVGINFIRKYVISR